MNSLLVKAQRNHAQKQGNAMKILINKEYIYSQVNIDANDIQEKDRYKNR